MIISIDKSHPVFSHPAYLKDVVPFNLMEIIKHAPMLLVSDGESFIVGMTKPQAPAWVWTADDISQTATYELCSIFMKNSATKRPSNMLQNRPLQRRFQKSL